MIQSSCARLIPSELCLFVDFSVYVLFYFEMCSPCEFYFLCFPSLGDYLMCFASYRLLLACDRFVIVSRVFKPVFIYSQVVCSVRSCVCLFWILSDKFSASEASRVLSFAFGSTCSSQCDRAGGANTNTVLIFQTSGVSLCEVNMNY